MPNVGKRVLRKALVNACEKFGITSKEFGALFGVENASYSHFIGNTEQD